MHFINSETGQLADNIINTIPIGMLVIDSQGKIILANEHALKLFSYQEKDIVGQSLEKLIPARYRELYQEERKKFIEGRSSSAAGDPRELMGLHQDGTEFPLEVGLSNVILNAEKMLLATLIDISYRKKLEMNYKEANANLEEFIYVASHDLKAPLRGILNLMDWICEDLKGVQPDSVQQNIKRVYDRIHKVETLIDDLLKYARDGRQSSPMIDINLDQMMEDMQKMMSIPTGFQIEIQNAVKTIRAPKTPLETILRNLVSNALQHHDRDQGVVSLSTQAENDFIIFSVIDDGPGIAEKLQDKVFKLFQTLNSKGSSGVGLAVVKRLVKKHGGRVELISKDNTRGCTFKVYWPLFIRRENLEEDEICNE